MTLTSKTARGLAALTLALPLVAASVAPATAASTDLLVDAHRPFPPGFGRSYGYPYGSPSTSSYADIDARVATAEESAGIVEITTTIDFGAAQAAGTGIVLSRDGIVVTNHHVVEGATSISVTSPATGEEYDARVLATADRVLSGDESGALVIGDTGFQGVTLGTAPVA